jgi:hypothetical protein
MTEVVNIYHKRPYDVYIGREGKGQDGYFGNPADTGSRESKIKNYREYFYSRIQSDPEFKKRIDDLKGKKLGCFCAPEKCHGMIIVEYLESKSVEDQMKEYTLSMGKEVQENIFDF